MLPTKPKTKRIVKSPLVVEIPEAKRTATVQEEMEETTEEVPLAKGKAKAKAKAKEKPAAKSKEAPKNKNSVIPEGLLAAQETEALITELTPPDLVAPERQDSAIRFCPVCRYYLYLEVTGLDQNLARLCRNCGFRQEDEKGGLVTELLVQEKAAEGYKILLNEFTRRDPRLPHIKGDIKCPDPGCESNHGGKESDVIYIKYDAINMLYLYICDVCGFQWRSRR